MSVWLFASLAVALTGAPVDPPSGLASPRATPHDCRTTLGPPKRPIRPEDWEVSDTLRIARHDVRTRARLRGLEQRSPTTRELLTALERASGVVIFLRANPILFDRARVLGQGRFWTARGMLYGVLEYQPAHENSDIMLRTIAHELAHAVEVVAHWQQSPEASIAEVARRFAQPGLWRSTTGALETSFVVDVTDQVRVEIPRRATGEPGRLAEIARRNGTPLGDIQTVAALE